MRTTLIVGVTAAAIGFILGTEIPKSSKTAGYVVITGVTKDRNAAKEYFETAPKYIQKSCKSEFLVIDRNTDIREGKKRSQRGPLTIIARFDSKQSAIDCYESSEYQRLIQIRKPHTDWSFRITEGMR